MMFQSQHHIPLAYQSAMWQSRSREVDVKLPLALEYWEIRASVLPLNVENTNAGLCVFAVRTTYTDDTIGAYNGSLVYEHSEQSLSIKEYTLGNRAFLISTCN